jgi:hypothetical protein
VGGRDIGITVSVTTSHAPSSQPSSFHPTTYPATMPERCPAARKNRAWAGTRCARYPMSTGAGRHRQRQRAAQHPTRVRAATQRRKAPRSARRTDEVYVADEQLRGYERAEWGERQRHGAIPASNSKLPTPANCARRLSAELLFVWVRQHACVRSRACVRVRASARARACRTKGRRFDRLAPSAPTVSSIQTQSQRTQRQPSTPKKRRNE